MLVGSDRGIKSLSLRALQIRFMPRKSGLIKIVGHTVARKQKKREPCPELCNRFE
jgi:hypothetical protein